MNDLHRCLWCCGSEIEIEYHDNEWGIPLHDDRKQFEFLMMEVMQCGLSWILMLKKRATFRKCFDNFDYEKIACYDEDKVQEIMTEPDMIKSIRKINAVINNARQFIKIREEFGSFDNYIWSFTKNKTLVYKSHAYNMPAKNQLSDVISSDLKKRGFKYLGSITVYSHLQACGIINDHSTSCYMYSKIIDNYPVEFVE